MTEDAEEATKESLRRKWAQLEAMVGTDKRIALVAADLVQHWEARYAAMEGKAMVVCMSRRICVELYKAIQKLRRDWHHETATLIHARFAVVESHFAQAQVFCCFEAPVC